MSDRPPRIVVTDADDERVRRAVARVAADGVATPVLVDPTDLPSGRGVESVSITDNEWRDRCMAHYGSVRRDRVPSTADVVDPLLFAALYCAVGGADAGLAGCRSASPDVIRAAIRGLGPATDGGLVAGSFLMGHGGRMTTYADVSIIPAPDAAQLATIAELAADAHRAMTGDDPLVAMLSFSTRGSADHADVAKVREATSIVQRRRPDLCIDGELQFDVAVDPAVAAAKAPESPVGGRANVLVFPDLDAGNIAYKVAERLGGARATGSFLLGLARPWIDLSRGCSEDDVVAALTALATACKEPQPA